jgi:hypothetical protein
MLMDAHRMMVLICAFSSRQDGALLRSDSAVPNVEREKDPRM